MIIFSILFILISYILVAIKWYELYQDYNDSAVPGGFYDVSNVPKQLYMAEVSDIVIDEALKHSITASEFVIEESKTTSEYLADENIINYINTFLLDILNKIIPGENHLFRMIDSKITSKNNNTVWSKHLVYRDTKMYGFYIDLKTYIQNMNISLISYKINGLVFEDKINALTPSNLTKKDVFIKGDQEFGTYLTEYKIM